VDSFDGSPKSFAFWHFLFLPGPSSDSLLPPFSYIMNLASFHPSPPFPRDVFSGKICRMFDPTQFFFFEFPNTIKASSLGNRSKTVSPALFFGFLSCEFFYFYAGSGDVLLFAEAPLF